MKILLHSYVEKIIVIDMLNKELVEQGERGNDGKTVNLYYDQMAGVYLAFGLSAYYTTMLVNVFTSYSELVGMPVALLRRVHVKMLRQSLQKVEHRQKDFYRFEMDTVIGEAGYQRWKEQALEIYGRL